MAVSEKADADGGADGSIIECTDIKDAFRKDKNQPAGPLRQRCAEAVQRAGILNGCVCIFYNTYEQPMATVLYAVPCRNKWRKVRTHTRIKHKI